MLRRPTMLLMALTAAACAADSPPDQTAEGGDAMQTARIEVVEPAADAVVGPDVHVTFNAVGVEVEPATGTRMAGHGHIHLFIDHDLTPAGEPIPAGVDGIVHLGTGATDYSITGLAPGEHRLIAVLGYGDHVPMEDVATDTVRIVVQAP
ncbi:MAG TPA: DUF4399 domain-containing protein [Longimicrobiales bacterium]